MNLLTDRDWKLKYTPEDGDLIAAFYVPALRCGVRYDRSTGYFSATALALAARGIEGLIAQDGWMRLLVGCTLNEQEVEAIRRGENLRQKMEEHFAQMPLVADEDDVHGALELLAWMVAHRRLEVRVAVPCDNKRRPVAGLGIFHEKAGIIQDSAGNRLAWNGSLNETANGWRENWESINVYTSWDDSKRVSQEEENFARIWSNQSPRVLTVDVVAAIEGKLLQFLPSDDRPARLATLFESAAPPLSEPQPVETAPQSHPVRADESHVRRLLWDYIRWSAQLPDGGERVGEATAAVEPWPHQIRAFDRLYSNWPPKLLIADEVGLGKTIQAGLLLRQAWLAGRANRVLILAPKAVLRQWQIELREKFNLNWPIYDGKNLTWQRTPAEPAREVSPTPQNPWHQQPFVLMSSQLARRKDRRQQLLEEAEPWDLVLLDEAHHARRESPGLDKDRRPNALLRLMDRLKDRTQGLVLLTATPMQVHPIEVWDLLNLLGLPLEWTATAFVHYFEWAAQGSPSHEQFEEMARLFRSSEGSYRALTAADVKRACGLEGVAARGLLRTLRDDAHGKRRNLPTDRRKAALQVMKAATPVAFLISRHTRALLRRYYEEGKISTPIATRKVEDRFLGMSPGEQELYAAVEEYISRVYNAAEQKERSAVGFVMTIYRRRLASSLAALKATLESRLAAMKSAAQNLPLASEEDTPDDETLDEQPDLEEMREQEQAALAFEERSTIEDLIRKLHALPVDTKLTKLVDELLELREQGYGQAMVFTQYTDTMDFLRTKLGRSGQFRLLCYSGRGGEIRNHDGSWRSISREETKRRFRKGEADVLLCTDAAAEGLNFQFCGALVNYDMPWNPMRVEQRIGRIDRLGQQYAVIRVVNLHYEGTVEADVYRTLRDRIKLFVNTVGRLQPILARLPGAITGTVLSLRRSADQTVAEVDRLISQAEAAPTGLDLDDALAAELADAPRPAPRLSLGDLAQVLERPVLLAPGVEATPMGPGEHGYRAPGMAKAVRVTTNADYYEDHPESVELWSAGSSLFPSGPPDGKEEMPEGLADLNVEKIIKTLGRPGSMGSVHAG